MPDIIVIKPEVPPVKDDSQSVLYPINYII